VRVAIVGRNGRRIGGTESYLSLVSGELAAAGHDVAFVHEVDVPADRDRVRTAAGTPRWCVAHLGRSATVDALRHWAPDVIYAHGSGDSEFEFALLGIAPIVFQAHDYYGTCISGAKMHGIPRRVPCRRRFGADCLALSFPRRCGGWHPMTMWREYRRQQRRLQFLRRCSTVVTASRYVASEYVNHGLSEQRVVTLPLPVDDAGGAGTSTAGDANRREEWRLLFLGRLDRLKGGDVFLNALTEVVAAAPRTVRVTFAGEGPARKRWQAHAQMLERTAGRLSIDFVGWADRPLRERLLTAADLLVLPSVWPEPFGLVGLEAGRYGVPTAAFDVGGISEWLQDGVGGRLAPGNPPTSGGLAAAIVDCLRDPLTHARLRSGARSTAERFTRGGHLRELCRVLEDATRSADMPAAVR
jgi:glycosyltransferase involved in cell wall biosynthesis